ncbi:PKD domain-containing protein [Nocardioides mangrovicus]|nr:PKD domain-containing protein [Nocardioides mangrovicus]
MVSAVPSAVTPQVDDGAVWSAAQVGDVMVIGGSFTSVGGTARSGIAAFNATTGAISSTFAPALSGGQVYSVLPGPDTSSVYVAGDFTSVNGKAVKYLTLLNVSTGAIVSSFTAPTFNYGGIRDMAKAGSRLVVGGFFTTANGSTRQGLASMSASSGALDGYVSEQLTGHHNDTGSGAQGYVGPWALDVSPDGTRLVVTGNFKYADGLLRDQLVMIDLNSTSTAVDTSWATTRYSPYCFNWAFDGYTRGITFSPDSSYFVVNATGGGVTGSLCDATSRFETRATGVDIQPTWVDQTGGDTVWGVTVTNNAVYIGGHNRWNNNPLGSDQAQPGAVPRPGLAALDPVSGRPYSWNPGHKPLGKAVYALLATDKGLWMAYDNNYIGNYKYQRQKIAFFPYSGGTQLASTATGKLPGTVYLGRYASNSPTNVLYRVDAGGPAITSSDGGPDWAADSSASPSPYLSGQTSTADWNPVTSVSSTVPAGTPSAIFDHERWSGSDNPKMDYRFPVATGTHVKVRLYFANRYTGTGSAGQRVFDVDINGARVLDHYDIAADVGDQTGTMKAFDATATDGVVDISFAHETENPLVNGIEIINQDVAAPTDPTDSLTSVSFDGTSAGTPQPVSGTSIPWRNTRGAFTVGSKLFYGSTDGTLYVAPLNGSSIGSPTAVNPYHDPAWATVDSQDGTTFDGNNPTFYSQVASVTGMFYSGGRLYFTMTGDSRLYSAWFSPDSGIVDNTEQVVSSSVDFTNAGGMFLSGNTLYYVNKLNGGLYQVSFDGTAVSGTPVLVNGPTTGGVDWTNKSMFFIASPAANKPPTASFTTSCSNGGCAVDAAASSDTDGSIASYSWDFGDGGTASGVNPSHAYSAAGSYAITLTVTDDKGASASTTRQVTVASTAQQVSFVGASHSAAGSSTTKTAAVPAGAKVGDTILLTLNTSKTTTWSGPGSGWTQVATTTNVSITSTLWRKQVAAGDLGGTVSFTSSAAAKASVGLLDYRGVSASTPIPTSAVSGDAGGFSHVTPSITAPSGATVVSLWADKSAAVSSWSAPQGVTQRDVAYDSGSSGRFSLLAADSNGPVSQGAYGTLTATTDASSDKAIMWTIALKPEAAAQNAAPTASYTTSCTALSCTFDSSASSDSDGTITGWSWDFGDGGTSTSAKPTHAYSSAATYAVKLTVTDNGGATGTTTQQVTVSSPSAQAVTYVGSAHSAAGSTTSKSVTVPAAVTTGDTMLLVLTSSAGAGWTSPPSGWTQVSTLTNSTISSTMWRKTAGSSDAGSAVSVTKSAAGKAVLSLAVYRNASGSAPVDAFAVIGDAGGTSHTTPTVTAAAGDRIVSWWTDKSTAVAAWTPPAGVTSRDSAYDTGSSGRFSMLVADAAAAGAGTAGGVTATTDSASDKAIMWTVALKPA